MPGAPGEPPPDGAPSEDPGQIQPEPAEPDPPWKPSIDPVVPIPRGVTTRGAAQARDLTTEEMVLAAARGDQAAWRELVTRYTGLVWTVARSYGLSQQDTEDVSQATWLLLATHVRAVRDPAAIGGWLA